MSRYVILGIALAVTTTILCMRVLKPAWFQNLFGQSDEATSITYEAGSDDPSTYNSDGKKIQMALILDTSNSMEGLIDQAKSQLWMLVNELAGMKKEGKTSKVEIALYQFGNDGLSMRKGYIEQILPLNSNLDEISQQLFELTTHGGSEYCGQAIEDAIDNLAWTNNPNDLKLIFIAGNEPFNQGSVNYQKICKKAKKRGILVNTIHCGSYKDGINDYWEHGAKLGGGDYLNIDHHDQVVHITTPYDDDIVKLNNQLNSTYIYYGETGKQKAESQVIQDKNALMYSRANIRTRAMVKTKEVYNNSTWDLVDLYDNSNGYAYTISEISSQDLPEEMQSMTSEERLEVIEQKSEEREQIKEELRKYELKVKDYVAKEKAKTAKKQTLDNVMLTTIRKQAAKKNFKASN